MKKDERLQVKLKYLKTGAPHDKGRHNLLYKKAENVFFPYGDAPMQGFNKLNVVKTPKEPAFKSDDIREKYEKGIYSKLTNVGGSDPVVVYRLFDNVFKAATDCKSYLKEINNVGYIENNSALVDTYPNEVVYSYLEAYISGKYPDVKLGYTKLDRGSIYLSRPVLFDNAIVLMQEMQKDALDEAPFIKSGNEVMRIYADLGAITNEIANLLRDKHQVKCQAINPCGGDVDLPHLAVKSGMAGFGKSGNVITSKFGSRLRISAILLQNDLFEYTDNDEYKWIIDFCENCKKCVRECPTGAIYNDSKATGKYIEGIGDLKSNVDMYKCHTFWKHSIGCSVCLKVCPFSQGEGMYEKIKSRYMGKINKSDS